MNTKMISYNSLRLSLLLDISKVGWRIIMKVLSSNHCSKKQILFIRENAFIYFKKG
jgi:hypothetical protein